MNIFYLSPNPKWAAQYHCDKHVGKMILESAQLLSSAHHLTDSPMAPYCYKLTHKNHPCAIWVRSSTDHYTWLFELYKELANEFHIRRGKKHKSWVDKFQALVVSPKLPTNGFTPPPQCMPDEYKTTDTVIAYRNYYNGDKARFAKWEWSKNSPQPDWFRPTFKPLAQV